MSTTILSISFRFSIIVKFLCRLTLEIDDVFATHKKACEARPGLQKCGWRKTPQRANSPTGVLRNPGGANSAGALIVCYTKLCNIRLILNSFKNPLFFSYLQYYYTQNFLIIKKQIMSLIK